MSIRRSRFSLCLVRRSESPKSPIGDRTRSSACEDNISTDSGCSTPLSTRKSRSSFKGDSPGENEGDYSPIPMTQDATNVVSGVSWAWNSPKRAILNDRRANPKPLGSSNRISYKDSESSSRSYKKRTASKLSGFQRFQSELKLLQESDESSNGDIYEVKNTVSCASMQVVPPSSPPPSPDEKNAFLGRAASKKASAKKQKRESFFKPMGQQSSASDSFNSSDFDTLLLQASQAVERDESTSDKSEVKDTLSCTSMQVLPPTSPPPSPDGGISKIISENTQKHESPIHKPSHDSFNNSDLDNILLLASQAVEKQLDPGVKLSKRPNLNPVTNQEQQPVVKRRSFFKRSTTTDNLNNSTTSDDSFPDAEFDLLMKEVVLPAARAKTNNSEGLQREGSKDLEKHSDSGYSRLLTRHKSMPESPSNKILNSTSIGARWKRGAPAAVLSSSSSNGSVTLVPKENDVVVIPSSGGGSSTSSATTGTTVVPKKCSKEEIEQKRQEALKRQASRLRRLMQGNHSQSEATFFQSKPK